MGRRKWKLYQDTLLSRNNTGDSDSAGSAGSAGGDEVEERPKEQAMPAAAPDPSGSPPAPSPSLKIKTIEEINTTPSSQTTILEALIKRAPPPPSVPVASTASQPEDWRPADKCYFCVDGEPAQAVQGTPPRECSEGVDEGRSHGLGGARATSPANSSASASSIESRRSPEPPALLQHLLQLQQTPQALAQFQRMAAQLAVALSGAGGLLVPPGIIPPWYLQVAQHNQMMNQHNQHNQQNDRVSSEASASGAESVGAAAEAGKSNETSSTSGARETEQPLDLSAKSGSGGSTASTPPPPPLHNSLPTVDVNNYLRNRMQPSSALGGLSAGAVGVAAAAAASAAAGARRAYTEDELQMALRDIQSGKLGTRRAAVLYGIPRSTLRNKVYKMSADRGRAPDPHDPHDDDDERDDDEWPNTTAGPYASYGVGVAGYSPYGSYAPYIRTLLQAAKRENDDERDEASAKHILKIPSFRFPPGSPNTDDDATQTTTQHTHVSQHAQHTQHTHPQHVPHAPAYSPLNRPPPEPAADAFRRALAAAPPHTPPARQVPVIQRQYGEPGTNATNAADDRAQTASTSGGKGTRPKRGKYRNYDRDSLVEAVKAVQRGEMSVHRAGSYYGVPHSTLEYKVKERHLMRPRKREPKPPAPPDDRTKPGERAKPPAGQLKLAQGKPFAPGVGPVPSGSNGVKQGAFTAPGFPFWPHATAAGFPAPSAFPPAPELFASHMMQRLRDESSRSPTAAATTVATHATHTTHANGSFLESVIRSSLERRSDALLERRSDAVLERRPDNVLERRSDAVLERRTDNALERRSDALLERLTRNDGEDEPPPRRPRLSSADRLLAEQMRDAVKQLRTDKLRPSNGANDESPPASHVPAVSSHAPVSHASTAAPHAQEQL